MFLAKLGGADVTTPTPITRKEQFLQKAIEGGGNSGGSSGGDEGWIGDGNTHIWIALQEGRTSPMLGVCPKGTVTVDWGDGTTPDTLTGTSTSTVKWTPTHAYAEPGDYVIRLTVDGEMGFYGSITTNENSGILRHSSAADTRNQVYQNAVQKIECGSGVTSIGSYAFQRCYSLASIAIPDSVTRIGGSTFAYCFSVILYDFSNHTVVPVLSNTNAFTSVAPDCETRVPAALYDEWIAATNWATYASQIVAV